MMYERGSNVRCVNVCVCMCEDDFCGKGCCDNHRIRCAKLYVYEELNIKQDVEV